MKEKKIKAEKQNPEGEKLISVGDFRNGCCGVLEDIVNSNEVYIVTSYNRPYVAVISLETYAKLLRFTKIFDNAVDKACDEFKSEIATAAMNRITQDEQS